MYRSVFGEEALLFGGGTTALSTEIVLFKPNELKKPIKQKTFYNPSVDNELIANISKDFNQMLNIVCHKCKKYTSRDNKKSTISRFNKNKRQRI